MTQPSCPGAALQGRFEEAARLRRLIDVDYGSSVETGITTAADLDYEGVPIRVARPEYLIALYLQPGARTAKRRERAAMLLDLPNLNRARLDDILNRYGLSF